VSQQHITVRVTFAWWWPLYFLGVLTMCQLTGMRPDEERFTAVLRRATRVNVDL
jgi:hypothetical protein